MARGGRGIFPHDRPVNPAKWASCETQHAVRYRVERGLRRAECWLHSEAVPC